ncbi:MAG: TonB-dependent receptor [Opitutaceae bacterium]|nr:TonB-dependent receptor [Opitutaceae bacterium]
MNLPDKIVRRPLPLFGAYASLALVSAASLWAQAAPVPSATAAQAAPTVAKPEGDETIKLSPFEVVAETKGYFSSNTMSGTRLNSKIEDLGQSITVMTKEQMVDFAMLDINDVFDHMASTEGTNSYSDFVLDRTGAVTDNVSLDPNNANRVRGIGSANIAFNNIATSGRVPVDPLWMDSLELSRGPNANIFGLGGSSGTVNQVPATASLFKDFTKVETRGDSYGGWRASFDVNRKLTNKLAVRASLAHQHTGFVRKPSGQDERRTSVQLKARPFRNTTLSLSYYGYDASATRPNYTTPRDYISGWLAAGKPAWNPVTRLITLNGVTYGQGMVAGSTTPITTLPAFFAGADARAVFRVGAPGEAPYWSAPTVNTNVTSPYLNIVNNTVRFVQTAPAGNFGDSQPLFATQPALADKSIYDWSEFNLQSANKQWDNVDTFVAQLDQIFLSSRKHTLAAQVTFMREDAKRIADLPMGPASVNGIIGAIYADPNIVNLDGTPNPYFGRPYLKSTEPYLREQPLLWDTTRAQFVYRVDFSQDKGLTKWIGTQQFLGYYEYKDQQNRHYAYRHTATSLDQQWQRDLAAAGVPLANRTTGGNRYPIAPGNVSRMFEQYYVGSTPGGGVEYGSSRFPEGATLPFVWGNTGAFRRDPTQVGFTPSPDGSGGNASKQTIVKTQGGVLQSTFLDGRLVTTFGLRKDKVFDRNAPFATLTPDLRAFDYGASDQWLPVWRLAEGETKTASVVVRPFRDLKFLKNQTTGGGGIGKFLADAVSSASLTYNKSDNFIAQGPAFDLFLRPLPNQTGKSKDLGLWMTTLEGRLTVRYTYFKTDQINFRNGDISTIAQRVLRADGLNAADAWNLQDRSTEWITQLNPTWTTDQVKAEVAKTMGLTQDTIDRMEAAIAAGQLAATQDIVSKGHELEINYNPTRAWTISASATQTESINQNAGNVIEEWIATRMPIWTTVEDPRFPDPARPGRNLLWRNISGTAFTGFGYNATNSAATNYVTFVEGPLAVFRQLEGRPRPQIRKYSAKFNTRYQLSGLTDNRILKNMSVGGSVRWTDKGAIGFYGVQSLPAKVTALDVTRPIYSKAETYVDLFLSYRTKLFHDKVGARFQLNVKNLQESGGRLQTTGVFPDGTGLSYRIIDPRQFILSASFDL